ncbi:aliphatic sulfonate ABC transporter substrate-binding protein [Rhodopila sp.]|jgi:aliphatic sulfonates family ABC transporter substrate-binding protein|uniref:aliphatic sulfonate ABC transporter substrate-binding protein n=1 Tax=Rhodopila sp. TaxID=2480087 RepID=UPI002BC64EC5|nr:aliphatic sulfonate ABC transporter substrate-binding protein [Rhodopila sp.]HVZ08007.1 aliphatic sulfonate ABC transporter substrate-binding protein [Rhodopila sp.]
MPIAVPPLHTRRPALTRRRALIAGLATPFIGRAAQAAPKAAPKTLRLGFQKGEPILMAARTNRDLEKALAPLDLSVEWIEFQFGPPMLEAMRVGGIDLGAVGDTPPIFAQAARGDLMYVAAGRGAPQSILLPPNSPIQALQDLKGRKLAFGRGSSAHNFALMVLEKAGLAYQDIQPIYLGPADAGAAFSQGAIEAWSIWEPYASLFNNRPGVRTLTTNNEIGTQYSYFMANGGFVRDNPALTAAALRTLTVVAEKARAEKPAIAALLAGSTGIAQDVWNRALERHPLDVLPLSDELARSQQVVADRFKAQGLIPVAIKPGDIFWHQNV